MSNPETRRSIINGRSWDEILAVLRRYGLEDRVTQLRTVHEGALWVDLRIRANTLAEIIDEPDVVCVLAVTAQDDVTDDAA